MTKVLFADKQVDVIEGLRFVLEMKGVELLHTVKADRIAQMIVDHKPDHIVIDIDMEGSVLASRQIRANETTKDSKIVAYTKYPPQHKEKYLDLYDIFNEVLTKPDDMKKLMDIITVK